MGATKRSVVLPSKMSYHEREKFFCACEVEEKRLGVLIASRIYNAMDSKIMTVFELARELGLSKRFVQQQLDGVVDFSFSELARISLILRMRFNVLMVHDCEAPKK